MNAMYQNVFIIIDKDLTNALQAVVQSPLEHNNRCWKAAWNKHFRHLSFISAGKVSAPSNDSANDCHICWQRAIFLPATFQAGDEESPSKQTVRAKMALHKGFTHLQGLQNGRHRR